MAGSATCITGVAGSSTVKLGWKSEHNRQTGQANPPRILPALFCSVQPDKARVSLTGTSCSRYIRSFFSLSADAQYNRGGTVSDAHPVDTHINETEKMCLIPDTA